MQHAEYKASSLPVTSLADSPSRVPDSEKPRVATGTAVLPHDPRCLGPYRLYLKSTLVVLIGRMIGRVLSVVGLTLVLFVLLT